MINTMPMRSIVGLTPLDIKGKIFPSKDKDDKMLRVGFKFRIYPTTEQKQAFTCHFGCGRWVYNWALTKMREHYDETKKTLSRSELQKQLVALKKTEEHHWLRDVNSQTLLSELLNLERAYKNFFAQRAKFPRYKSKSDSTQTYQCPQHAVIDSDKGLLHVPKIKGIKVKVHRALEGKLKTVTITLCPSGKYYVSGIYERDGHKVDNPKYFRATQERLAIAQKKFARKKKGSKNYTKQRKIVACTHEYIRNQRHDFLHQITAQLVRNNHATSFCLETLHVKGMIRNRKLSKSIQDASWGRFLIYLAYKCEWYGKNVLQIGRFEPSSKLCHSCGHTLDRLPLSVREWQCPSCLCHHDRDINAALNIKALGLADVPGHGTCVKSSSVTMPVSTGVTAKGAEGSQYGSQEALTGKTLVFQ